MFRILFLNLFLFVSFLYSAPIKSYLTQGCLADQEEKITNRQSGYYLYTGLTSSYGVYYQQLTGLPEPSYRYYNFSGDNRGKSYVVESYDVTCTPAPPCTDEAPPGYISYPMEYGSCKSWDSLTPEEQSLYAPGTVGGAPICNTCQAPAVATCSNNEYVNANNDCVSVQFPANFPDETKKGIPAIRGDGTISLNECNSSVIYDTEIAHAQAITYDYGSRKCLFATFYCNDGLTWNKTKQICEVPKDTESTDTVSDYINDDTKAACTSGLWAKSWTYDYCGQTTCYMALDVQDYNLQCGNKYIKYECTSDYRVKTFKQVSCGEVDKSDFDTVEMQINPPANVPPPADSGTGSADGSGDSNATADVNITRDSNVTTINFTDSNTSKSVTDYSNVISIIHGDLQKIDSSIGTLIGSSSVTNQKISQTNSKLDGISSQLSDIKKAINPLICQQKTGHKINCLTNHFFL